LGLNPGLHIQGRQGCRAISVSKVGAKRLQFEGKRFHFIGAGGVGMSGLASLLIKNGAVVAGSDQTHTGLIHKLCQNGADIKIGHSAENLSEHTEAVVISAAIKRDNPELKIAREKGLVVYKYAELLGKVMDCYHGIAVCGTHGKSTTCGWLVFVMQRVGLNPSFIVGADISQLGCSSSVGNSKFFLAEACEYDRSFLNLHPKLGVVLNIEQDHLDYYRDENEIIDAFGQFMLGVQKDGTIIVNGQDANVARAAAVIKNSSYIKTFGIDGDYDFSARNVRQADGLYEFDFFYSGNELGKARLSLPGRHNILNALAVASSAIQLGIEPKKVLEILPEYQGVERRLMLKAKIAGVTILDDYAHHPTEIKASLEAIRERFRPRRIWCVFQPHQYSRTRFLLDDFAESFKLADITIVPDIYFVRDTEAAKKEVNSEMLVEKLRGQGSQALFISSFGNILEYLRENVRVGDLIITMGAGDIWKLADEYIQWPGKNS
jgi:UDP-N-acetylmuramate--alanine ligase